LLITATFYLQAAFFDFVYDDFGQIVYNPGIKSWHLALGYFSSHVWAQTGGLALYYRPVFMLWLTANYRLFHLDPLYWHLAAIALHVLSCLLLYLFARRLTGDRWTAVVGALLFGLHPAHIESVAWVSGATDPLLAIFVLGALLCYQQWREAGEASGRCWLAASLFISILAMLTKEVAVVLPGLIFAYEWIFPRTNSPSKNRFLSAIRIAIPYAGVVIGFLVIRARALHRVVPPHASGGLAAVLAWPKLLIFYLAHTLFPYRMSAFYNLVTVRHPGFQNFVWPLILISAGAAGLWYGSQRSRVFAFLTAWGILMLIPILNVTLLYNVENVHDRYLYLPSVAFCIMLASLLGRLKEIHGTRSAWVVLSVIAAGYGVLTISESRYWRNDFILAQRGINVSPGHPLAPQVLGNAYIRQAKPEEAIPYLLDGVTAQPDNVDTLRSLGLCYSQINALPLAEEYLAKALAINPADSQSHAFLGMVRFRQGRLNEAEAEIRRSIALRSAQAGVLLAHYYLGEVLYAKGDVQGALREYQAELLNDSLSDPAAAPAMVRVEQIEKQFRARIQ
jgi:tetratricopeptide (TPR) repeat protein